MINYLSWKDVRKNAKDSNSSSSSSSNGNNEDISDIEINNSNNNNNNNNNVIGRNNKMSLFWSLSSSLLNDMNNINMDGINVDNCLNCNSNDPSLKRLKKADDLTKSMDRSQYVHYSECRQASFTFKKSKKFRDWLNLTHLLDSKPSDEVLETLAFLAYEIVGTLTETSIKIKRKQDKFASYIRNRNKNKSKRNEDDDNDDSNNFISSPFVSKTAFVIAQSNDDDDASTKPLTPIHVRDAFQKLQTTNEKLNKGKSLRNFKGTGGLIRNKNYLM